MMDATRFAQLGRWKGGIGYGGRSLAVDRAYGTKDRSWGIRPIGPPELDGAPAQRMPQFCFFWAPLHWPDRATHFGIFEDERGDPWHRDGAIVPIYERPEQIPGIEDPGIERMASVERRIAFAPGTRWAESAAVTLVERTGERHVIELEPLLRFQMKGLGYTHPEWGHGRWKGELALTGESWKSDDLDPLALENLHVQQVVRARLGDQEGVGVLEQIILGPHEGFGFEGLVDGAS